MNKNNDVAQAAKAYYEQGFKVIPLYGSYPLLGEIYAGKLAPKMPLPVDYLFRHLLNRSAKSVERRFRRHNGNLGVLVGAKHGLLVLDIDYNIGGKEAFEAMKLPATLTCDSPNGMHVYYRYHAKNISNVRLFPGVCIKGESSWLSVPPSCNYAGVPYRWRKDGPQEIMPAPDFLVQLLEGYTYSCWEPYKRLKMVWCFGYGRRPLCLLVYFIKRYLSRAK